MIRITEYLGGFSFEHYTIQTGQLPLIMANHIAGCVDNTSESSFVFNSHVAIPKYRIEWHCAFYQPPINHFKNVLMDFKAFQSSQEKMTPLSFFCVKFTWSQNVRFWSVKTPRYWQLLTISASWLSMETGLAVCLPFPYPRTKSLGLAIFSSRQLHLKQKFSNSIWR